MIPDTVREAARRHGDAIAYVGPNGLALSYAELDTVSDEVAAGLAVRGLREGSVLALALAPSLEYLVAYLGAAKVGAITAGVNNRLPATDQQAVLDCAQPDLVLTPDDLGAATTVTDLAGPIRATATTITDLAADPDRPVAIVFTSGTTGRPKGARYDNRQLDFITRTEAGDGWGGGASAYAGTPFAHLGFMTKTPGALRRGGTTYVMERWTPPEALRLITEHRLATVAGVPTQLALLLREPDIDTYDVSCVRAIVVGGGPLSPAVAAEARARFGAPLANRYSCTEAGLGLGTALNDPPEDAEVSVGRPFPGIELAVLDHGDRPVTPGEIGRVHLRSAAVMTQYWRNPEATAAAFTADGFVRTGDLGFVDDRGRLRLAGRAQEMYVRGGENVFPMEVEAVLSTHPGVAAVAVVPRPDPVMGEIGVAVVVPDDPVPTLEDLRAHARSRLAGFKLPEAMVVVPELPLTAMEKIDRRALSRLVTDTVADR